jgi:hypothetical protein
MMYAIDFGFAVGEHEYPYATMFAGRLSQTHEFMYGLIAL